MSAAKSRPSRPEAAPKPGRTPRRTAERSSPRRQPAARAWGERAWPEALKAQFIGALADGAAIDMAVAAVGRSRAAAFSERVRDPVFALAWDEAVACEEAMIEARLIERAIAGLANAPDATAARDAERVAMWILGSRPAERAAGRAGVRGGAEPAAIDPSADIARADALLAEVAARIAAEEANSCPG